MFLIRKMLARRQVQGAFGPMLQRADDHLLDDIGLTRAEVSALLRDPPVEPLGAQQRLLARRV